MSKEAALAVSTGGSSVEFSRRWGMGGRQAPEYHRLILTFVAERFHRKSHFLCLHGFMASGTLLLPTGQRKDTQMSTGIGLHNSIRKALLSRQGSAAADIELILVEQPVHEFTARANCGRRIISDQTASAQVKTALDCYSRSSTAITHWMLTGFRSPESLLVRWEQEFSG